MTDTPRPALPDPYTVARIAVLHDLGEQLLEPGGPATATTAAMRHSAARWLASPNEAAGEEAHTAVGATWRHTPGAADTRRASDALSIIRSAGLTIGAVYRLEPHALTGSTPWDRSVGHIGSRYGWALVAETIAARWPDPVPVGALRELLASGLPATAAIAASSKLPAG